MDNFTAESLENSTLYTLEGWFKDVSTSSCHSHSCHQLLRMRSGTSLLEERNRQQPLFNNMTAFIPAGVPHRSLALGDQVHYKSIYLDKRLWPTPEGAIRIFDMSPLGTALFDRIVLKTNRQMDWEFHLKCLDLLLTMLDQEMKNISDITRIPLPREKDNLRLTAFIKAHYTERLTLEAFSQVVHYSSRHLSRRFKADLGISLFEYLKLYRIFRAAIQLSMGSEPVAQVAFAVGYESLSSFYKDFRQLLKVSPGDFRRQRSGSSPQKSPGSDPVFFQQGVEAGPGQS